MKIEHILYSVFSSKPVIVVIHGFSSRTWHPLNHLIQHFKQNGFLVMVPELFDTNDEHDADAIEWIERAKTTVREALDIKDDVVVIGFSMGGVIASEIAARFPLKLLVLIAPAFEYITMKAVKERLTKKITRKPDHLEPNQIYKPLPDTFMDAFKNVVSICKHSIKEITCPLLVFHGRSDLKIPLRSSEYVYHHVLSKEKKLFILEDVQHNIIEDRLYYRDVISIIEQNIKK
jgi:esterase/lipase